MADMKVYLASIPNLDEAHEIVVPIALYENVMGELYPVAPADDIIRLDRAVVINAVVMKNLDECEWVRDVSVETTLNAENLLAALTLPNLYLVAVL